MSKLTEFSKYHLGELRDFVNQGQFTRAKGNVVFNLDEVSGQDLEVLIELVRHKLGFSQHLIEDLQEGSLVHKMAGALQEIRSLIYFGKFSEALEHEIFRNPIVGKDLLIEKVRAHVFLAQFEQAKLLLESLLASPLPNLTQKGVALQMYGHCLTELGDPTALVYLNRALETAIRAENFAGQTAALLCLAKLEAINQNRVQANIHLEKASQLLKYTLNFRWILGFYRTAAQVHFFLKELVAIEEIGIATFIAESLQDIYFQKRSQIERAVMLKSFGDHRLIESLVPDLLKKEEQIGDLAEWSNLIFDPNLISEKNSKTLQLFKQSLSTEPLALCGLEPKGANSPPSWILDLRHHVLIDVIRKNVSLVTDESPAMKLVAVLNKNKGELLIEEAFNLAWGLRYSQGRHLNTIKSTLLRLKQSNPALEIKRNQGKLYLNHRGIVLEK